MAGCASARATIGWPARRRFPLCPTPGPSPRLHCRPFRFCLSVLEGARALGAVEDIRLLSAESRRSCAQAERKWRADGRGRPADGPLPRAPPPHDGRKTHRWRARRHRARGRRRGAEDHLRHMVGGVWLTLRARVAWVTHATPWR